MKEEKKVVLESTEATNQIAEDAVQNNEAVLVDEAQESKDSKKEKKIKKDKKKKLTVEELLAMDAREELDNNGDRKKIKVKVEKKSKLLKREARMGYLFIFPWIIGFCLFVVYPLAMTFKYSFGYTRMLPSGALYKFTGIENFQELFSSYVELPVDFMSLLVKFIVSVPMIVVFSLIIAMFLNMKIRCRGVFRAIYFLPVIVVSGPVMAQMMSETSDIEAIDSAAIQQTLESTLPMFLASALSYIFSNIIILLWYSGVQILIFLAALQKIDTSLYEAAKIDGGSSWECFWKITLPTIKPMLLLNSLYTLIYLSQDTNTNTVITTIKTNMTNGNKKNAYGYGSALALVYSIMILLLVVIIVLLFKSKKDQYAKQVAKSKRLEKKTRRAIKKAKKHAIRNDKKFAKKIAKNKANQKDTIMKGGRFDE